MQNRRLFNYLPSITKPTLFPCHSHLPSTASSLLDRIWTNTLLPTVGLLTACE